MMEIFGGAAFSIDMQAYIAIVFRGSGTTTLPLYYLLQENMALADLRLACASIQSCLDSPVSRLHTTSATKQSLMNL